MKIGRFSDGSEPAFWGVLSADESSVRPIRAAFAEWAPELAWADEPADEVLGERRSLAELVVRAPVEPGGRIFGVGMNYVTHLEKLGSTAPSSLAAYIKPDSAVVDPFGEIRYPVTTAKLDYEVELVLVVAAPIAEAGSRLDCLLGYTAGNDISPRDVERQTGGADLYSMKGQDRTAPIGPWVGTIGAFGGRSQPALTIRSLVNGEVRQEDKTTQMIFDLDHILGYVNTRNRLRAGDVIFTGTTCGVGLEDGRLLQPGDVVEVGIEEIGFCRNVVGAKSPA
jgi:2-keto-4-pentenoate hydratase/2-oxohepta-3-ene-1,7-dioic acid hydratase in catechol pathway